MATKKVVMVSKIISSIMLIVATFIVTVPMAGHEKKMREKEQSLGNFKYDKELNLVEGLYISEISTERRLDILDAHLEARIAGDKERQIFLLNQVLNRTIDIINNCNRLYNGNPTFSMLPENLDNETDIRNRIKNLELKLGESRENAVNRYKKAFDEARNCEKEKADIEKKYGFCEIMFKWLQIIGLIILGISEILEKL